MAKAQDFTQEQINEKIKEHMDMLMTGNIPEGLTREDIADYINMLKRYKVRKD